MEQIRTILPVWLFKKSLKIWNILFDQLFAMKTQVVRNQKNDLFLLFSDPADTNGQPGPSNRNII